jgi:hypothetical protein
MVPVFFPAAPPVPHAVLAEEKVIIRDDGWFHVGLRYYASAPDADKMRRLEAERRVAERERHGRFCAWCDGKLLQLVTDDTLVDFDGEMCRWGSLMIQDRKTVEMKPDGSLVGGYNF